MIPICTVTTTSPDDGCYSEHLCGVFPSPGEAIAWAQKMTDKRNKPTWFVRQWEPDAAGGQAQLVATNDE